MSMRISFGILAYILLSASAQGAPVTYQFTGNLTGAVNQSFSGLKLVVSDTAVAAGSLNASLQGNCNFAILCTQGGDVADFVSIGWTPGGTDFTGGSNPSGSGSLSLGLTFNPDGTLSGSVRDDGNFNTVHLLGTGASWSGTFSSDALVACGSCNLTGSWLRSDAPAQVPEAPSGAILAAGLGALWLVARRKRAV